MMRPSMQRIVVLAHKSDAVRYRLRNVDADRPPSVVYEDPAYWQACVELGAAAKAMFDEAARLPPPPKGY